MLITLITSSYYFTSMPGVPDYIQVKNLKISPRTDKAGTHPPAIKEEKWEHDYLISAFDTQKSEKNVMEWLHVKM